MITMAEKPNIAPRSSTRNRFGEVAQPRPHRRDKGLGEVVRGGVTGCQRASAPKSGI